MANADISLLFGVAGGGSLSGESGRLIKEQLAEIEGSLNEKPFKIKFGLDTQSSWKRAWTSDIKAKLDELSNSKKFSVQVSNIKIGASAISDFKNQLSAVINTLNLGSGTSIKFSSEGIGEVASNAKKASEATEQATRKAAEYKVAMKEVAASSRTISSELSKLKDGSATSQEVAEIEALTERYRNWLVSIEEVNIAHKNDPSYISALKAEGDAIYKNINGIKEARAAIAEKAAADAVDKGTTEERNALYKRTVDLITRVAKAQNDWSAAKHGISSDDYNMLKKYIDSLEELKLDFDNLGKQEIKSRLSKINREFAESSNNIKQAGENAKTLSDRFGGLASKFTAWLSVSQIIMQLARSIRQMIKDVVDVDTAMTELRKVTDETDVTYSRFLANASARAKELGAVLSDVVNATADFARLGYTLDEASKLADVAIVYKHVGDGIADIGEASSSIISTMRAFGIEANDAMGIVDKFNEVGNNFAISSKGVGDALLRSASALNAANNSLDESIAMITAANSVVQDADKVGTSLKTVSMFLRAAKTEAEEAGESTEGMADSVSKLRKELLELTGGRVDIQLDNDTFKSTYQILKELSEVWDSLSDITQANITEKIGGKRNSNVISALLKNFEYAEDVLKTSADAAGSALAENEKYLDSIQGRIDIFKASFQELATTFIDSGFVKNVVSFGTVLLNILTAVSRLFDAVGGLNTALATTAGVMVIVKASAISDFFNKTQLKIVSLIGSVGKLNNAMGIFKNLSSAYVTVGGQAIPVITRLTTSLNAAGIAASAAQVKMFAFVAAVALIAGSVAIYNKLHKSTDELLDDYQNMKSAVDDLQKQIDTTTTRIEELQRLSREGKITLVEQEELDKLKETNRQLEEEIRLKDLSSKADPLNKRLEINFAVKSFSPIDGESDYIDDGGEYASRKVGYEEHVKQLIERYKELSALGDEITDTQRDQIKSIRDELSSLSVDLYDNFINKYAGDEGAVEGWRKIASSIDSCLNPAEHFIDLLNSMPDDLAKILSSEGADGSLTADRINELADSYSEFKKILDDSGYSAEELASHFNSLNRSIESNIPTAWIDVLGTFDSYAESMSKLADLQDTISKGFTISAEKAREFAGVFPEILEAATVTADGEIALNQDVVTDFISKSREKANSAVEAQITQLEADKEVLNAKLAASKAELELAKSVGEGEGKISKDVAQYRLNTGNALTEALIANGVDEANAYALAAAAMAEDEEEFARVAMGCFKNLDENSAHAAYNMAHAIYTNADQSVQSISDIAAQAHETAKAISAMGNGEIAGSEKKKNVRGGGRNSGGLKIDLYKGTFKGSEYSYDKKSITLDNYISDLNLEISEYTDAIKTIDSKIAILQSLSNKPLSDFSPSKDSKKSSSKKNGSNGNSKNKSDSSSNSVKEYIADTEKYYSALKKLESIQIKLASIQSDIKATDDDNKKVELTKQLIDVYSQEIKALEELNSLRSKTIQDNIVALKKLGFQVDYNSKTNEFYVRNLEHVNELQAKSKGEYGSVAEATNELRKNTENLIKTLDSLNKANQDSVNNMRDLKDSIRESKDSIVEYLNNIVKSANEVVDGFQNVYATLTDAAKEYAQNGYLSVDSLQSILDLGPKYLDFLMDENGNLTINEKSLQKVIAARTDEMGAETALSYAKQILLATEQGETKTLRELTNAMTASGSATWDMAYATLGLARAIGVSKGMDLSYFDKATSYILKMQSLSKTAVNSVSAFYATLDDGYVNQKSGLETIIKLTEDMIKQENQGMREALEKQKSDYADIIALRKEALNAAKEDADYEDKIAEKVKEIAKLQSRIDSLSLDDSREANAEKIKLEEEMQAIQKELGSIQSDKALDAQNDALDKLKEDYDKHIDDRIESVENSLSSEEKLYQAAIDRISNGWDTLYKDLTNWNYEYGSTLQADLVNAWNAASDAVKRYGSFVAALDGVGRHDDLGSDNNDEYIWDIIDKMKANGAAWGSASAEEKKRLSEDSRALGTRLGAYLGENVYRDSAGVWWVGNEKLFEKYKVRPMSKDKSNSILSGLSSKVNDYNNSAGYRFVDFNSVLSNKIGKDLDASLIDSVLSSMTPAGMVGSLAVSAPSPSSITNNNNDTIHFGDVYIYGTDAQNIESYRQVTREFTNEVIRQLNIKP